MSDIQSAREPRREDFLPNDRNPFASDVPATRPVGAIANAEQQRSIAEVQARMIIARSNPRDPVRCMDLILQDCTRPSLAKDALYQYARGGSAISGPSIRLAEAIAQRWGNIASGIKEISRSGGYSECVAYAWDLESGYYDERQFQVRHWRDTRQGGHALTDERDIYELIANMGQRRKRAVMLTVIPGDVTEAAVDQCEQTLRTTADTSPEALARIAAAFEQFGVTKAQIEKRCQCRLEAIRPAQVVQLRKIFASIKDGMSDAKDWFDAPNGAWGRVEETHAAASAPATEQSRPAATRKAPAKKAAAETATAPSKPTEDQVPFDRWEQESQSSPKGGAPPQGAEGGPDQTTIGQTVLGPTAGEIPATTLPTFSQFLVDGEGYILPDETGADREAYTDPVAFAHACVEAEANEFPGTLELFRRANHKARQLAMAASNEVAAILAPKPVTPVQQAPQMRQETSPSLLMEMPVDPLFVPAPTSKARPEMVRYNDALTAMLDKATTDSGVDRVMAVNAPTYDGFADPLRLKALGLGMARKKELAPAPARGAPVQTMGELAAQLEHDIYSLVAPESCAAWLGMPGTKAALDRLIDGAPDLHDRVMKSLEAKHQALVASAATVRTPRQILNDVIGRMRACSTSDEAVVLIYRPDHIADTKALTPELLAELKAVAVALDNEKPDVWGPVKAIYAAKKPEAA